jgi:hypothetical protein
MRVLVVAALGLGLQLYYWYEILSFQTVRQLFAAKNPEIWLEGLIVLCLIYLVLDGLTAVFRNLASVEEVADSDSSASPAKDTSREEELSQTISALNEKVSALETALRNSEELNKSSQASRSRSDVIDAELVNLLSLLQEKGRLIDFLMEDVTVHPDAQVAAVARVVHQGCSDLLKEYFSIKPMHQGGEGETVTLETSFNPRQYRLVGSVHGEPPFNGTVLHRGWVTEKIGLPRVITAEKEGDLLDEGPAVIAPAEVEVVAS